MVDGALWSVKREQCMLAVFLSVISQTCHTCEFTLNFLFCQIVHWNYVINKYLFKESYPRSGDW